ncbi:MAG: inositol monophosphatase [Elusimicrobia bacterium]|nr:inositol monophosphatase [Elusimicrobiota bacterium]
MNERFTLAVKTAKKSGDFLKEWFGRGEILSQSAYDVKLKQDVESEKIVLGAIESKFPEDGYIAEEKGEKKGASGCVWIIDPLDGTVNYYRGIPHCCVSIACIKDNVGFGVVYDFFRDEMFTGKTGEGAFLNDKAITVSKNRELKDMVLSYGLMKGKEEIGEGLMILGKVADKVKKIRTMGSAALDICYVAAGRTDLFLEVGLYIWDIAAGKIIVESAGGVYKEDKNDHRKIFIVSNGFMDMERLCQKP